MINIGPNQRISTLAPQEEPIDPNLLNALTQLSRSAILGVCFLGVLIATAIQRVIYLQTGLATPAVQDVVETPDNAGLAKLWLVIMLVIAVLLMRSYVIKPWRIVRDNQRGVSILRSIFKDHGKRILLYAVPLFLLLEVTFALPDIWYVLAPFFAMLIFYWEWVSKQTRAITRTVSITQS